MKESIGTFWVVPVAGGHYYITEESDLERLPQQLKVSHWDKFQPLPEKYFLKRNVPPRSRMYFISINEEKGNWTGKVHYPSQIDIFNGIGEPPHYSRHDKNSNSIYYWTEAETMLDALIYTLRDVESHMQLKYSINYEKTIYNQSREWLGKNDNNNSFYSLVLE